MSDKNAASLEYQRKDWHPFLLEEKSCPLCGSTEKTVLYRKRNLLIGVEAPIQRCSRCQFTYSGTHLSPEGAKSFYEMKYERSNYASYSRFEGVKIASFKTRIEFLRTLSKNSGKRLLDLGCGEGLSMQAARELGYEVTGIEISERAAAAARKRNLGPIHCTSLNQIDGLGLGLFDVITLFDVLDHVSHPLQVLRSATRLLAPAGVIYVDVCDIESPYAKLMGKNYTHIIPFEHLSYFNAGTLDGLLTQCGLTPMTRKSVPREISFEFLTMTLREFNPVLGRILEIVGHCIPSRARSACVRIPIGVLSVIAMKG